MSSSDGDAGAHEESAVERRQRHFPHADEIVIPEDLQLETDDPPTAAEAREARGRPGLAARLLRCSAARCRTLLDRMLLVVAFVVPLLILAWQSFEWLRTSVWPLMPVARPLQWLQLDVGLASGTWPGVSRLLEWLLGAPLVAVLFVGGFALHLLLGLLFPPIGSD